MQRPRRVDRQTHRQTDRQMDKMDIDSLVCVVKARVVIILLEVIEEGDDETEEGKVHRE